MTYAVARKILQGIVPDEDFGRFGRDADPAGEVRAVFGDNIKICFTDKRGSKVELDARNLVRLRKS